MIDKRYGYTEHICKSSTQSGREYSGYICIVTISGHDTVEAGLSNLRKRLNWHTLDSEKIELLMKNKPKEISFTGKDHDSMYGHYNNLQITDTSAKEWVNNMS